MWIKCLFFVWSVAAVTQLAFVSSTNGCQKQSNKDITGDKDLRNIHGKPETECCQLCKETSGCKAYAWNDFEGGTCWLKSAEGPIIDKGGVSIGIVAGGANGCQKQSNKDIGDKDLRNVHGKPETECCQLCKETSGCKAYSWNDFEGGTCWLKSADGPIIDKAGVSIGIMTGGGQTGNGCQKQSNKDIGDKDLRNVHGKPETECCQLCKETSGCKAYSWNDFEGGTCWLKSADGPIIDKAGVSIGIITGGGQTGGGGGGGGSGDHPFTVVNHCPFTVWVGVQGSSIPQDGGWALDQGQSTSFNLPRGWKAGRFWGRTGCKFDGSGKGRCETGDCGRGLACKGAGGVPPVSLAEFTLDGHGNLDYYDISLVDGYNLPMEIALQGNYNKNGGGGFRCSTAGCVSDLNAKCPGELAVKNSNGQTVACKSACEKFREDRYCCHGANNKPETCNPTTWPTNYAAIFKQACPKAYSYAYDDQSSTFTCSGEATGYKITFCP